MTGKLERAISLLRSETSQTDVEVDWIYKAKLKKNKKGTPGIVSSNAAGTGVPPSSAGSVTNTTSTTNTTTTTTTTNDPASAASLQGKETLKPMISPITPQKQPSISPQISLNSLNSPKRSTSLSTTEDEIQKTANQHSIQTPPPSRSLLSKALRQRSNSDSKGMLPSPQPLHSTHGALQVDSLFTKHAPTVSASISNQQTSQQASFGVSSGGIKRSNSLNEKTSPQPSSAAAKPAKKSLFSAFAKLKSSKTPPVSPQIQPQSQTQQPSPQSQPLSIPQKTNTDVSHNIASSLESLSPPTSTFRMPFFNKQPAAQTTADRMVLNKNPNKLDVPLKELHNLKLKRVTFALDKLLDDPPQQIPSRRPKLGNVLIPEDLLETQPLKLSVGITNETKIEMKKWDERDIKLMKENRKRFKEEAEKHAQEAHFAAQRIAHEVVNYKAKSGLTSIMSRSTDVDDIHSLDDKVKELEIDKPIHLHEHHFEGDGVHHESNMDVSLETIYTRCCHLREILPIPATLKQLKGKTAPLQTLKMLNPKPTLIDIYSFTDFASIVEIKNLIFDNVTMTSEMLKILFASIINSKIEKLSFRNVSFDENSWKYLCKYLVRNTYLMKLDISQQKIKSDVPPSQHRSEMNWLLFIESMKIRGGIDELILNGVKFGSDLAAFKKVLEEAVNIKTKKLGLAQCELTLEQIFILSDFMEDTNKVVEGLDLGYNDLSYNIKPLIRRVLNFKNLKVISINSTNLTNVEDVALFIKSLSKLPDLQFLDLSNLSSIFPGILPYLKKYLPRFPHLVRIHLDHNDFSTKTISILCTILPKCSKLIHVSITGLPNLTYEASASLYGTVKSSKSLMNFDLDYELMDDKISSRIAITLMKNMQKNLNNHDYSHHEDLSDNTNDDILFDGSLLAETASNLLDKINSKYDSKEDHDESIIDLKFLKNQFMEKIAWSRSNINKSIDELLNKRSEFQLSLDEKEFLLRLYFLENSLKKIQEIFETLSENPQLQQQQIQQMQLQHQQQQQLLNNTIPITAEGEAPHQMALDTNQNNQQVPIDMATGRPIMLRSLSQQSIQAKKLEEEEGEFHKWGFFVQQQKQIMPQAETEPSTTVQPEQTSLAHDESKTASTTTTTDTSATATCATATPQQPLSSFMVPKLPSGSEIRDAVIKAKGIQSISTLIESVNNRQFSLHSIYPTLKTNDHLPPSSMAEADSTFSPEVKPEPKDHPLQPKPTPRQPSVASGPELNNIKEEEEHEDHSQNEDEINGLKSGDDSDGVDEAYDILLNDISRVRSNK